MNDDWFLYPDISEYLARNEDTTSANAGAYASPFGGMQRRVVPEPLSCAGGKECSVDMAAWHAFYNRNFTR